MTSSYSQFVKSITDRATDTVRRLGAGTVVGVAAVGTLAVGAGALSVPSDASADTARPQVQVQAQVQRQGGAQTPAAKPAVASQATPGKVISIAEKQIGVRENQVGQTKFHHWYTSTPDAQNTARRDGGKVTDYHGAAWCDMFVSWVGAQAGVKNMGRDAYTVSHAKWFEKTQRWGDQAKPGAVVFFDWAGGGIDGIDHVGLVVKDNGNGTITTIEGNTGNQAVEKKVRPVSQVVGYGYPEYASAK